jgi:hypothetical protein
VELLLLLEVSVVLGDSFQCELFHEVDKLWVWHVLLLERLDCNWVGGRKKRDLLLLRHDLQDFANNGLKVIRQKFINLVKNNHLAVVELGDSSGGKIEDSAWSCDDDMDSLVKSVDIFLDLISSRGNHALDAFVLAQLLYHK